MGPGWNGGRLFQYPDPAHLLEFSGQPPVFEPRRSASFIPLSAPNAKSVLPPEFHSGATGQPGYFN